jgi:hypothetical protein
MVTKVTLWEDNGRKGDHLDLYGDDKYLGNNFHWDMAFGRIPVQDTWDNETSSLQVTGGTVRFYIHSFFEGKAVDLEPGIYNMADLKARGIPNDSISSVDFSPFG